ncbi:MAG TPA: FAD-dependent oxidoreductase [Firmicutes bacterium]|nr:FAD-dependent oxidoreductase [Bacillota bacterium]
MDKKKLVVIGGDAAGMSCASQVKRLRPTWEVIVFEKNDYISYAACGMPYFIEGLVPNKEELLELTPEIAISERKIDLRIRHEVIKISPRGKKVVVKNERGEEKEESFDVLLIATGSLPQVSGINYQQSDRILVLKNLEDMEKIDALIRENPRGKCAAIGGGYIGIEMIEAFRIRGLETHLIHRRTELARTFEKEISDLIIGEMARNGVVLHLGAATKEIREEDEGITVTTDKGNFNYDFVFLGLGVAPANKLAKESGIELGLKGSIKVNEYLQTNYPYIYAAGDCVQAIHILSREPVYTPLGLKANKEGMLAGMNIAGTRAPFGGILGTAITKCFALGVSRTGLTYEEAARHNFDAVKITLNSMSRARYYPGAEKLFSLVVAEKSTGLILGAQLAGPPDAVKRIDVYATAIYNHMTLDDVFNLDLAYAPPFAPVYDPVLLAARVGKKAVR